MAKKKTLAETAVDTLTELTGADKKTAGKIVETVAALAGVETEKAEKPKIAKKKPAAKTAAKKPAAKKETAKKAAKSEKPAETKSALSKSALPIEYQCKGGKYTGEEIIEKCKAAYRNGSRKTVRSIEVYVKGYKAYFVVNGKDKDEDGKPYFVEL